MSWIYYNDRCDNAPQTGIATYERFDDVREHMYNFQVHI